MSRAEEIGAMLRGFRIEGADCIEAIEPLSGGVSSDVFRVDLPGRSLCVKFAIERLRVADEWRAPIRRSEAEYRWLHTVGDWCAELAPEVLGYDDDRHGMAMVYLPPETHANWKTELLGGRVDAEVASRLGARLATVHARSAFDEGIAAAFANQSDFEALRIDPYLRFTATRHPDLAGQLTTLAEQHGTARIALVHGDVSPKNVLCGPDGPVLIDAECATFGDPAFDAAFLLNHLVIKSLVLPHGERLREGARAFWCSYRKAIGWESAEALEARVAALIPALMLARVDGKSPLEYLTDEAARRVRTIAGLLLRRPASSIDALLASLPAIEEAA